jgi:restriction endonuclease S subunit
MTAASLPHRWRRYPSYMPSGVEWLGEVPEGWDVQRVKSLERNAAYVVQTGPFGAQLHSGDYVDEGVPFILIKNVNNLKIDDSNIPKITFDDAERLSIYRLELGDIVFSRVGSIGRIALCTEREKGWVISGQMLRLRIKNQKLDKKFSLYVFSSKEVERYIDLQSVGSTRESINTDILKNMALPTPPLPEQHAIAAFLDRETTRIDALIEKKERQIALLQEKRAALISHAVTKGLDPSVPMKDSGVEWLGRVPKGWGISKFGYHSTLMNGINFTLSESGFRYKIVGVSDFQKNFSIQNNQISEVNLSSPLSQNELLQPDDLLFVRSNGNPKLVGRCLFVDKIEANTTFSGFTIRGRITSKELFPKFFAYFTSSDIYKAQIELTAFGTNISNISQDFLKTLQIPLPPFDEQIVIVDKIEGILSHQNIILENLQKSIHLLIEYRSALISAAVTGKIDVRQEAKE